MIPGVLMAIRIILYYLWVRHNAMQIMNRVVEQAILAEKLQKAEASDRAKSIFLSNMNIEEKECSISDIFKDMRNIIQSQMQSKQLNFFMDTVDVVDENIYCDKLHVNQVLLNLLSNAIKFTPAGGTIALTIKQKPRAPKGYGSYEIRVKDTGIGMRSEWAMHGKEAVRQIRSIVGDNAPIFLSELRDILLSATCSSVSIQQEKESLIPDLSESLKGTRLLLTEDNELNREIAVELLMDSGFIVDTAEDGTVAVEKVKNSEPGYYGLILMDIQMPKMNGYEATKAIRALDSAILANIPIVAMTANAFEEDRKQALDCGMNAHIAKPIDVEKLLEVITNILNQSKISG